MRRYWWAAGTAVVISGLALTFVLWPRGRDLPPARARVYTDANACLLTDASGVVGPQAAPVWSGMESASVRTKTKVSYLAVYGDDSITNAVPYVNTLVQRKCDLVIGVGSSEVGAVLERAGAYPAVRFAVVGSKSAQNVTAIAATSPDAISTDVNKLVAG